MKKLFILGVAALFAASFPACKKKVKDAYAGVEGDYVSGTPLPERIEGANFFGSNVTRGQFSPVYFGYDSFSISDAESGKVQEVASAMKSMGQTLIIAGFTDERGTEEYRPRAWREARSSGARRAHFARRKRWSHSNGQLWRGNACGFRRQRSCLGQEPAGGIRRRQIARRAGAVIGSHPPG